MIKNRNREEVQPYKDINEMTREEMRYYFSKPHVSKSGIIVETRFNENGEDFNELMKRYF